MLTIGMASAEECDCSHKGEDTCRGIHEKHNNSGGILHAKYIFVGGDDLGWYLNESVRFLGRKEVFRAIFRRLCPTREVSVRTGGYQVLVSEKSEQSRHSKYC